MKYIYVYILLIVLLLLVLFCSKNNHKNIEIFTDLPGGGWKQSAKNYQASNFNVETELKNNRGNWVNANSNYEPGDNFNNTNGKLKYSGNSDIDDSMLLLDPFVLRQSNYYKARDYQIGYIPKIDKFGKYKQYRYKYKYPKNAIYKPNLGEIPQIKLHYVSSCNQCGNQWCSSNKWLMNKPNVESYFTIGSPLSNNINNEFSCYQIGPNTPIVRNSSTGSIYAVEIKDPNKKGTLHYINDCNQCGKAWCSKTPDENSKNLDKYYNIGKPLLKIGCNKINSSTLLGAFGKKGLYAIIPQNQITDIQNKLMGIWKDPKNSFYKGMNIKVECNSWEPVNYRNSGWRSSSFKLEQVTSKGFHLVEINQNKRYVHYATYISSNRLLVKRLGYRWELNLIKKGNYFKTNCNNLQKCTTNNKYMDTFNRTGCQNRVALGWWKNNSKKVALADMYAYCELTKNGTASKGQKNVCCGNNINCKPAKCVKQTDLICNKNKTKSDYIPYMGWGKNLSTTYSKHTQPCNLNQFLSKLPDGYGYYWDPYYNKGFCRSIKPVNIPKVLADYNNGNWTGNNRGITYLPKCSSSLKCPKSHPYSYYSNTACCSKKPTANLRSCPANFVWCDGTNNPRAKKTLKCYSNNSNNSNTLNNTLKYNKAYYLKNLYTDVKAAPLGSYMASCGYKKTGCTSQLAVSTYNIIGDTYLQKSSTWSKWKLKHKNNNIGRTDIYFNDIVTIQLEANNWYLITCATSRCNSGSYLSVSCKSSITKSNNEGYWKIISPTGKTGPVRLTDTIKFLNLWGSNSYLTACGWSSDCGSGKTYALSTTKTNSRSSKLGVSNWQIFKTLPCGKGTKACKNTPGYCYDPSSNSTISTYRLAKYDPKNPNRTISGQKYYLRLLNARNRFINMADKKNPNNCQLESIKCNIKRAQTVYTGCGYTYESEGNRNKQCGSGGTSKFIPAEGKFANMGSPCDMKRSQTVYTGCGYIYQSKGNRNRQCGRGGISKWIPKE